MTAEHTDWCSIWNPSAIGVCDCNGGRCPNCGQIGPCGYTDNGTPLICTPTEKTTSSPAT